jgi:inner membrane protein YidH
VAEASATSPGEGEPDYRMSLAAERTYLAYVRTGLALLVAGVAVVSALPNAGHESLRQVIGVVLVITGLVVAGTARNRWKQVDRAMRHGQPLPKVGVAAMAGWGVLLSGVLGLWLVVRG